MLTQTFCSLLESIYLFLGNYQILIWQWQRYRGVKYQPINSRRCYPLSSTKVNQDNKIIIVYSKQGKSGGQGTTLNQMIDNIQLIKINMSKQKFLTTNRERFSQPKTQQLVSQELKANRKSQEKARDLLLPLEIITKKHPWHSKPLRSEGKSSFSQREGKMPIFELLNLKESLLLKQPRDSFNIKTVPKRRTSTNRIMTEKIPQSNYSAQKKANVNKILIRGGGYSKQFSPEKNNFIKQDVERVFVSEHTIENQVHLTKESPRKSLDKKLTPFEREESKNYEIFYIGSRRINNIQQFTNTDGDPKIINGDAIAYKYQIVSILGRGSFGHVFKAYDHKKKEFIALKIIKNQDKFTIQAKVQIQILQTAILHDPKLRNNVVRLKGSFIFRGHTCLKFQILNKNLYQFLKETNFSGFSLDLIRRFTIQILQTLFFFSKHRIIHCDLKPENILLKQENKSGIKVIDVGSGCFEGKQIYTYIQSRFYRAPQIILGVKYTTAIDMWSLGCILVQLYTGVPLFPGQNENEQMLMFIELLGLPPQALLERAQRRKRFFTDQFTLKIAPSKNKQKGRHVLNWKNVLGSDCDKSFVDLIKKCLIWQPSERLKPREALLHEWIITGLPHTIRSQHVEQLSHE